MTKKHPVALVTGGGRGIGRAVSAALAAAGYSVAINYLHSEAAAVALAAELRQSYGTDTMAVGCDVSSEEQVNAMLHAVGEQLGEVDLLINNAGIAQQKLFTDITAEDWDRLFAVDVRGVFLCCRGVLPHM
ncbi:MAG: SDR family NAD(P)-dependent oxidoreductase, partial [Angelakisella sp.]